MDIYDKYVRDGAASMRYFAGNEGKFIFGEWKAWRNACIVAGKLLAPELFKKSAN